MRFLNWFAFWRTRNNRLDSKVASLSKQVKASGKQLAKLTSGHAKTNDKLVEQVSKLSGALREQVVINERLEETLLAVREELRTSTEITIPGLVAAHDVLLQRWRAESAIQVARATFGDPQPQRG